MSLLVFGLCLLSLALATPVTDLHNAARHKLLSDVPDQACTNWLLSSSGSAFLTCFTSGNMTQPPAPSVNNSCMVDNSDYDAFCLQPCYATVMAGLDYIVSSRVCYSFLSGYLDAGCKNDTDCGTGSTCWASQCYLNCNTTADCAYAGGDCDDGYMCFQPNGVPNKICNQNATYPNGKGTPQFASVVYSYKLLCSKSGSNYCGVYYTNSGANVTTWTCNDVASWGCCTGSVLNTFTYCLYETVNNPALYMCPSSTAYCSGLPSASSYCGSGAGTLQVSLLAIIALIFGSVWSM